MAHRAAARYQGWYSTVLKVARLAVVILKMLCGEVRSPASGRGRCIARRCLDRHVCCCGILRGRMLHSN